MGVLVDTMLPIPIRQILGVTLLALAAVQPAQAQQPQYDWEWLERQGPLFTPFQVPPDIANREYLAKVKAQINDYVAGDSCATTGVWFLIDRNGITRDARVHESSGDREMDRFALAFASAHVFSPALWDGKPVPAWITISVTIGADECETEQPGGAGGHTPRRESQGW
jgi:TonB family protein